MLENSYLKKAKAMAQKTTDGVRPLATKASESVNKVVSSTSKKYEESGAKEKVDSLASVASKKYEESGAKSTVDTVSGKVSESFDVVSGQAMFQAVQDRLTKQDQYNDVLANKLLEALERISQLEQKLGLNK